MNEPRIFQHSPVTLIFVFVLLLFMFGVVFLGFGFVFQSPYLLISIGIFVALLAVFAIYSYTSKAIVSEEEIATRTLFGSKSLRWMDINRVSGSGYGIKLHNFDEDVTIAVGSRLPGYQEIVEWIGRKRPELFPPEEYSEMRRSIFQLLGLMLALAVTVGVGVLFLWATDPASLTSMDTIGPLIFLAVIGLFILGTIFSIPQSLTIEGGTLRLKYLLKERILPANEIAAIALSYTQTRNGKRYFIALHLTGKKTIRISGLNVGLPIAYLALKNWHEKNA